MMLQREISPPPHDMPNHYGSGHLKLLVSSPPPQPEQIAMTPSVPESFTANTDDEANVSPEPLAALTEFPDYSPKANLSNNYSSDNDNDNDSNHTHSRTPSNSYSYEESKVGMMVKEQEIARREQKYIPTKKSNRNILHLDRPKNLPAKDWTPNEDEDDEIMDKILVNCMYHISSASIYNPNP